MTPLNTEVEFWRRVERSDGCWLWSARRNEHGYGLFRFEGRDRLAHRLAWSFANGPISDRLHVLHRCDVPACVNAAHLFVGTHQDNMADKVAKGRCSRSGPRGSASHLARLTEADVVEIRLLVSLGIEKTWIGRAYGVTASAICGINARRTWKHVAEVV